MAKILSPVWSIIRGSIAGTTYLSGPNNAIVARQRVAPVQPNTNPRTNIKAAMGQAVAAWEALNQSVRDDWASYAQTVTFVGPLGSYQPSGRQLAIGQYVAAAYVKDNTDLDPAPAPTMASAPTTAGQLATPSIAFTLPDSGTGFKVTAKNNDSEGMILYCQRSLAQSNGRNFYKGPWVPQLTQADTAVAAATAEFDFTTSVPNAIVFVRVRGFSSSSPRRMCVEQILRCESATAV